MAYKSPKQILAEAPQIPQELKEQALPSPLTLAEQKKFTERAKAELSPIKQAFLGTVSEAQKGITSETEVLKSKLKEQAEQESLAVGRNLAARGFFRSGEEIGRKEEIGKSLVEGLSSADLQRASKLADLALQSAQFEADIASEVQRRATQFGEQEMARREFGAGIARQKIEDIREERNIFLQEEMAEQEFRREMAEIAAARTTSASRLDTSWQDIGGRRVLVNNQTGDIIKDVGVANTSISPDQQLGALQDLTQDLALYKKEGVDRDEALSQIMNYSVILGQDKVVEQFNKLWKTPQQIKSEQDKRTQQIRSNIQTNVPKFLSGFFNR